MKKKKENLGKIPKFKMFAYIIKCPIKKDTQEDTH